VSLKQVPLATWINLLTHYTKGKSESEVTLSPYDGKTRTTFVIFHAVTHCVIITICFTVPSLYFFTIGWLRHLVLRTWSSVIFRRIRLLRPTLRFQGVESEITSAITAGFVLDLSPNTWRGLAHHYYRDLY